MAEQGGRAVRSWPLIGALSIGSLLNPLNSSMVAVALVTLRGEFGLDLSSVLWIVTAFYLASATAQPLMGRLADRFGPKRLFVLGMALVIVASALAPLAPDFAWLCVARVAMAIGTATAFPSAVIMLSALSDRDGSAPVQRLAVLQVAGTAAAAIGPAVGGVLVTTLGWQALFTINVPLAAAALWGIRGAPADPERLREPLRQVWRDSDVVGIVAFVTAMVLLISAALGALPAPGWAVALAGLVAAAFFVRHELRTRVPFLDLRTIARNRSLVMVYLTLVLVNAVFYAVFFGLPQLLEETAGYSPQTVGLLMLPLTAVSILVTPLAARAIGRWGVRAVMITGVGALVGAGATLGMLTLLTAVPLVLAATAIMGVPYAIASIAASHGMYASAPESDRGVASGIFQTFRYLGSITATVMIGLLSTGADGTHDWGRIVLVMLLLGLLALGVAVAWRPRSPQ